MNRELSNIPEVFVGKVMNVYDDYASNWNIRFTIPMLFNYENGFRPNIWKGGSSKPELNDEGRFTSEVESTYPIATPLIDPQHEVKEGDLVFILKFMPIQNDNFFYLPMYSGNECCMNFRNNKIDMTPNGVVTIKSQTGHDSSDAGDETKTSTITLNSNENTITIDNGTKNTITLNTAGDSSTITIKNGPSGNTITMTSDGTITINSETKINVTVPNMEITSEVKVNGNVRVSKEVIAMSDSSPVQLSTHIHTGNLGNPTSPPLI